MEAIYSVTSNCV